MFPDRGPQSDNRMHTKFTYLVMKCMILCWLSIISSALALMLYLWRHIATLIEINIPFVCLCVVLMHIKYDDTFKCLCRPCIMCYGKTVGVGRQSGTNMGPVQRQRTPDDSVTIECDLETIECDLDIQTISQAVITVEEGVVRVETMSADSTPSCQDPEIVEVPMKVPPMEDVTMEDVTVEITEKAQ